MNARLIFPPEFWDDIDEDISDDTTDHAEESQP